VLSRAKRRIEIDAFLFRRRAEDIAAGKRLDEVEPLSNRLQPGQDGEMLTGDKNFAHGLWSVEYVIDNAYYYVRNVGERSQDGEPLLRRLAENAIVRSVASRRAEELLKGALGPVTDEVQGRLQKELTSLGTGLLVNKVGVEMVWPRQVRQAFDNVEAAASERQKLQSQAAQTRTEILNQAAGEAYERILAQIDAYGLAQAQRASPQELATLRTSVDAELERAGGKVAVMLRGAQSRKNQIRENVRLEYEQFRYYLNLYKRDPQVTMIRLWSDMREAVQRSKTNEFFVLPQIGDEIWITISRDPNRAIQRDLERYRSGAGKP
jgi:regulator of protease activity HflC (stomatin/prohibitin superfamily)